MARIKGNNITDVITPTVNLINMSSNPVGAIVAMWIGSRYEKNINPDIVDRLYKHPHMYNNFLHFVDEELEETAKYLCECYPEYAGESGTDYWSVIDNVAKLVVKSNLPPLDAVNFCFEINDANVAWREQIVRGRQPQNFWTQTSRTADLTTMDVNRLESIEKFGGEEAVKIYDDTVQTIRNAYQMLVDLGVPSEDIRLIPQGMTHRVYWMVPYRTLSTALRKRTSWIAQSSLWTPIIEGIQSKLFKYAPFFADILGTPSDVKIADGKVVAHTYDNENEDRYYGRDPQPCDPLWLAYRGYKMPAHTNIEMYDFMKKSYLKMWSKEVCDILGWDKSNPEIQGPYDRPEFPL